jgi:osmotically inducible protein OsmC
MAITRTSEARWEGDLKNGNGRIKLGSGTFEGQYGFKSRFESGPGTNPEELIAAAHAGCYSMALSNALATAGFVPTSVQTAASVMLDKLESGFTITKIILKTQAKVPNIDAAKFQKVAEEAKKGCPVSKALSAVPIELNATLS